MINVTRTFLPSFEKYQHYLNKIFTSGWVTNGGQFTQELEKRLEKFLGVENLILVANGTLALQLAYKLLSLSGEIITTPFSFIATTSSIVWEGISPIFADINPKTLCINPQEIRKKISKKTSGIVPVHVFGNPCEVDEIEEIARENNLKIIYDAAHAFGIKYRGSSILRNGDISTLSFHATKVFHTIEGGALIINKSELYQNAKKMINFGITGPSSIEGLGINAKMNEFQAAMGLCVLDEFEKGINYRKIINETYKNRLNGYLEVPEINHDTTPNYGYFPIIFSNENSLLKAVSALNAKNINPRRYFYPSLDEVDYVHPQQICEVSRSIAKRILCLPIYDGLDIALAEEISNTIIDTF